MNVFAGTVRGGSVDALGARWPLPAAVAAVARDGQAVQYGIRPTDLQLAASGIPAAWWWSSPPAPRPNCCCNWAMRS